MEHAEVLELIELAAVEPGGLERLTAGDTPEAAAVAGHVAGCAACAAELGRTARAAGIAAEAIRELPDPALRARTLAFVRDVGVERSSAPAAAAPAVSAPAATAGPTTTARDAVPSGVVPMARRPRRVPWWAVASAAAVIVAGVAGFAVGGAGSPQPGQDVATVMAAAKTTMHIAAQADAAHIALASTTGDTSGGTVLFSVATGELSMSASNLPPVASGWTYACWVEVGGAPRRIGALHLEGADGTWAGWVGGLDKLGAHPVFGVSLVKDGEASGTPVLRGGG